jgi:hypothetical protein
MLFIVTEPDKVELPFTSRLELDVIEPVITVLPAMFNPAEPDILPFTTN